MKNYKILIFFTSIALILIFGGLLFYNFVIVLENRAVHMEFIVGDKVGFNLDRDALYFGTTYPGGSAKRNLNITNTYDFPVSVSINVIGELAPMVTVSDNSFVLGAGEKKAVTYHVVSNVSAERGLYNGTTILSFKRALFT